MIKVDEQFVEKMVNEGKFDRVGNYLLTDNGFDGDVMLDGWNPSRKYKGFKIGDEIEDENDVFEYWDGSELLKSDLYHRDYNRVKEANKKIESCDNNDEQIQKVMDGIQDIPLDQFGQIDYTDEKYWNELTFENTFVLSPL